MTIQALSGPLLIIANGPQWGQRLLLSPAEPVVIGRASEHLLPIANDQRVSKNHCLIEFSGGHYWLRDLRSRNGTWLRGQALRRPLVLGHGDSFRCGSTEFAFWDPDSATPSAISPELTQSLQGLLQRVLDASHANAAASERSAERIDTISGFDRRAAAPLSPLPETAPAHHDVVIALQRISLFKHLGAEQLDRLALETQYRTYEAGTAVVRQGDEGLCMYSIISGQADVVRVSSRDGSEQRLATFGPDDFFGEMALFDALPRSATVRCTTALHCLLLTRWTLTGQVRSDPELAMALLEALSQRLRAVERLI